MKSVVALALLAVLVLSGCARHNAPSTVTQRFPLPEGVSSTALFTDVATKAGIRFTHTSGATGKFYYIENTPPGCAFLDFDGDGWLDIFLVQSGPSDPFETVKNRPTCALYKNNGDGTFREITTGSGLDADIGYGQGVTIGDFDNDGYPDILVTAYDRLTLFHNEKGAGKFTDVTRKMGMDNLHGYFTSAAFGDYDNDGRLDLYVCRYGPWSWKTNIPCRENFGLDYCSPTIYPPDYHLLLHNDGNRFRDVSQKSGILSEHGWGLAVAFVDFDGDGKQDIFVANDQASSMLWRNNGDGTFTDTALSAGVGYDAAGQVMAGMGIAIGDYDRSGHPGLFVSNFSDKPNMLFRNLGGGTFEDKSYPSGLALPHMKFLAFGTEFLDYDADGWLDLLVVNGHIKVHVEKQWEGITYKQRKQLFRNEGTGRFVEVTNPAEMGDMMNPTLGRGLAIGDFDNDGRVDALVSNQNGSPELFHNELHNGNHWVSFITVGTRSNREGRHTRFLLTSGGVTQTDIVRAGSSYLSASDRRVYFGLNKATVIEKVEVQWPSGTKDTLTNLATDTIYTITEGAGVTGKRTPTSPH